MQTPFRKILPMLLPPAALLVFMVAPLWMLAGEGAGWDSPPSLSTALQGYVAALENASRSNLPLPSLHRRVPAASLDDAYRVQGRFVRDQVASGRRIGGFKGAAVGAGAQKLLGISAPLSAVLWEDGRLSARPAPTISLAAHPGTKVETEIGFLVKAPIRERMATVEELRDRYIAAIVPVIELPAGSREKTERPWAVDVVATNVGSHQFIVGRENPLDALDETGVQITMERDGNRCQDVRDPAGSRFHWSNLLLQVNRAVTRGFTLEPGNIVITGAVGKILDGVPGNYAADFGQLGTVPFRLTP